MSGGQSSKNYVDTSHVPEDVRKAFQAGYEAAVDNYRIDKSTGEWGWNCMYALDNWAYDRKWPEPVETPVEEPEQTEEDDS